MEPDGADVYLLLNPFRCNVREFGILTRMLADLDDGLEAVQGHYASELDAALIGLCFSHGARRRLGPRGILDMVARTGLPMVVPERLSYADAHHFFLEHLARFDICVVQHAAAGAPVRLVEGLVRRLGEEVARRPRAGSESDYAFDLRDELPLVNARRPTVPDWMHLGAASDPIVG
ncbi:MAG TPA: hypothetical protein VM734_00220 [Kofleriaceae bacterium]|nr:hypothetical protein [Kofleriaceae bacterium]